MRIIHLTDLHLSTSTDKENNFIFTKAIKFIEKEKNNLKIDCIIITGDITHHGEAESYELFFNHIETLKIPYAVIPGNHDCKNTLKNSKVKCKYITNIENISNNEWLLCQVDSTIEGQDDGLISESEVEKLQEKIVNNPRNKIALFLHHHPINVGTPLVDSCKLTNPEILFSLCEKYPILFIGTGHAHTLFQQQRDNTLISIAPALSSQWKSGTQTVKKVHISGFNVISLNKEINIETYYIN